MGREVTECCRPLRREKPCGFANSSWRESSLDGLGEGRGIVKTNVDGPHGEADSPAGLEGGVRPESAGWGELRGPPRA